MNNKFLSDYLIQNFWDSAKPFDSQEYLQTAKQSILDIQSQIDNLNTQFSINQKEIEDIDKQILEKENQILKLKDFIDQKSWMDSLKNQIDKLSQNLNKLENEKNKLLENKQNIQTKSSETGANIKKLESQKSDIEISISPDFKNILRQYIESKSKQISKILLQSKLKKENQQSKFSQTFESQTKDQYPFEEFQAIPEILQQLQSTFDAEKSNYISINLENFQTKYSKEIIDTLEQAFINYNNYIESTDRQIDINVDYEELDYIYKSTLSRNKIYFPHLDEIRELANHPLFKKQWEVTLQDIYNYQDKINKKKDAKKLKRFWATLNTIMLDYNISLINISQNISSISEKDIESILSDPRKKELYSSYLSLDKDLLIKLQRIVNLFNSTRAISFQWFEDNIIFINQLINDFVDNLQKYPDSLQDNIKDISNRYSDELNELTDNILDLVEKNNLWKDVLQQIMILQNIIRTIQTYFQETYKSKDINTREILDKILWHIVEKMSMETFSLNIIEDIEQKNNLLTAYNDIWNLIRENVEAKEIIQQTWSKPSIYSKLSSAQTKTSRVLCLFDMLKKLAYLITCKNIYDISKDLFLENKIDEWDWKAWAELYKSSSDFKVPSIDPILISADKFGIWSWEYMFESYDISDSSNYMAYIRLFHVSNFKNYERIKSSLCKNWKDIPEKDKIKDLLDFLLFKDWDIVSTTFVFPELTPIIIDKDFEISLDWINPDWLKYIIWDKKYEMLRTYLFYNFMEANREHDSIVTNPKDLIWPCKPKPLSDPDSIKVITINPDMPRTVAIPRSTGWTKNFEYKRETIVIQNPKCTTWPSWFHEAKNHWKKLYAHVHNINDFPTRKNSIEKIRLDTCDTYEEFLEKLEQFRKKYSDSPDLVVRVETYRSEFEKYKWAKQKVAYRIAQTQNSPSNIVWWEKKKRWRPRKNPQ